MSSQKIVKIVVVFVVCVVLGIVLNPFKIIPADSLGLKFTMGKLSEQTMTPGLAVKIPIFQSIDPVSLRPIQLDLAVEVGPQGAITKDNQTIGALLTVFYKYKPEGLIDMYSKYGESQIKNILKTGTIESFKSGIGVYDIFNISISQNKIQLDVLNDLKVKLSPYPIIITELRISNYDWSDAFDAQIEATMTIAQLVKQKEQELQIANQEAQKRVKVAEAEKQATILKAEGEKASAQLMAEAKALEGEGIRKYNESIQKNMELELALRSLEIRRIEAEGWNGQYVSTNNYGPIPLQAGSLLPSK